MKRRPKFKRTASTPAMHVKSQRPMSAKKDPRQFVFNRKTKFEGQCAECNHLHEEGVLCGKIANLNTLDKCRCTRGRRLKRQFVSRDQKKANRIAKLKATAEGNKGWVCTVDDRCGSSFDNDIDFYRHMREECTFREVWCPHTGCKMTCIQRDLIFHQKYCPFRASDSNDTGTADTVTTIVRDPQTGEKILRTEPRQKPLAHVPNPNADGELSEARKAGLMTLFHKLDRNKDGFLHPLELAPLLRVRSGRSATEAEVGCYKTSMTRVWDSRWLHWCWFATRQLSKFDALVAVATDESAQTTGLNSANRWQH